MRFAVDAHAIGRRLTGNEVYVRSLLNGFASLDRESEFIAYLSVDRERASLPSRFATRRVSSNPFIRLGWDLSYKLGQDRPDLVHVQYTAPLNCPTPVVVTVHDVSFLKHAEYFPPFRAAQLRATVARTIHRANRVVTVSEFSREAILEAYGVDSDKVVVAPNAAGPEFRPIPREHAIASLRNRFPLPAPLVLCVGDLQPRKNQIGLIHAFSKLICAHPELRHHLVLAGQDTWFSDRVREAAAKSGVADRIHFTGFVSDKELFLLYNACELFVFPSFYEGFGLPVLEAMACGRAVACSNISALPEVADGAALFFNPYAADEIARAMADALLDPQLRHRMERLGLQRAAAFSWQKTAQKTLEIYREVLESEQPARAPQRFIPTLRR